MLAQIITICAIELEISVSGVELPSEYFRLEMQIRWNRTGRDESCPIYDRCASEVRLPLTDQIDAN